jgi:hypothetical protein
MSDERTPEKQAADDALLEAVQNAARLTRDTDEAEAVMEYVVIARLDGFGLQDRGSSAYVFLTKDGGEGPLSSPHHSIVGLLHYGLEHMRSDD